jgi:hypothetical protein
VTDVEHELLRQSTEQMAEIARLREVALRAARAAAAAQDRSDGSHEAWLDDLVQGLAAATGA